MYLFDQEEELQGYIVGPLRYKPVLFLPRRRSYSLWGENAVCEGKDREGERFIFCFEQMLANFSHLVLVKM